MIATFWILLTFMVERKGGEKTLAFGPSSETQSALIVYNPDLFYNLDEQVCTSFAEGLAEVGWSSKVVTVAAAEGLENEDFNLYVFCTNTYNWAPDWPISRYIKHHPHLKGKNAVAFTLGSGSTKRSQRLLEDMLKAKEVRLLHSSSIWLMKPNDQNNAKDSNVGVAVDQANSLAKEIAQSMTHE